MSASGPSGPLVISVKITIMIFFLLLLVLHNSLYTQSFVSSYIYVSVKVCTWQPQELSYLHVIKSGWGKSIPRRKNNNNFAVHF